MSAKSSPCIEPLESRQLLSTVVSTVAVDLNTTYQTIRGIGASFAKTARNPGAPMSDAVMKYTLDHLHPTDARVPINLLGWEPKPDNADPSVINWAGFKDTGRQHEQFLQIQDFAKRGMTLMASIFDAPNWMVLDPQDRQHRTVDPKKYGMLAEGMATWLIRLRDTYGVKISNISINESNGGYNLRFSQTIFRAFLHVAGPMFTKMGLGYVKWVVGDDGFVNPRGFLAPVLNDPSIAQYIGAIGWHTWNLDDYPDSAFKDFAKLVKTTGKEVWATETGYDPLAFVQHPAEFTTWDNASQYAKIYIRALKLLPVTVLDYWEFADDFPLVSPKLAPYPTFYIIQSYADNLVPGSTMVKASASDSEVLSIAAKDQAHNHFFAQAMNTDVSKSKTVTFTGLPNQPLTLTRSDANENGVVVGTYTPVKGKLTLKLPADSVNTLSGNLAAVQPAKKAPPKKK